MTRAQVEVQIDDVATPGRPGGPLGHHASRPTGSASTQPGDGHHVAGLPAGQQPGQAVAGPGGRHHQPQGPGCASGAAACRELIRPRRERLLCAWRGSPVGLDWSCREATDKSVTRAAWGHFAAPSIGTRQACPCLSVRAVRTCSAPGQKPLNGRKLASMLAIRESIALFAPFASERTKVA